jgi:putative DNA primase/helicase
MKPTPETTISPLAKIERFPPRETTPRLSLTLAEFLAFKVPPRKPVLSPWLNSGALTMVHAWRGVGKTHFGLGVAYAVASGGTFLRWSAPGAASVLYVDGEMPGVPMQERLSAVASGGPALDRVDRFRIVTPDCLPDACAVPNLLSPEGQAAIDLELDGRDLVVFDNVATLFRTREDQNTTSSWVDAQDYLLRLRRRGHCVVLIDHDNKSGGNRGTSAKHDVLDTVIQLTLPSDYHASEGARFKVEFTKHRGFWGKDAAPFEAQLTTLPDGSQAWTIKDADGAKFERVVEMVRDGLPERRIRSEEGVGGSMVRKAKAYLKDRGGK